MGSEESGSIMFRKEEGLGVGKEVLDHVGAINCRWGRKTLNIAKHDTACFWVGGAPSSAICGFVGRVRLLTT